MNFEEVLSHYTGKRILITGGAGCIGSNLTRALLKAEPERIIIIDDLSASYEWNIPKHQKVIFIHGSILDEEKMKRAFSYKPHYVFHLAAHFANQNSVDHPETDLLVNGLGTLKTLEYANLTGVEKFIFASSGCSVYGSQAPLPLKEDFISLHLDTPYQIHKLLGELYCNYFHNYYGLPVAIARYFNVYGPGEVPGKYRNVIPNFIWWAMHSQPLPITGTGEETRDFTYVEDIVDGTLRMGVVEEAVGEAINLASGTETRIIDLANWINEITGNKAGIIFKPRRDWDKAIRRRASIEKARKILGYEPKTDMKTGLRKVYEWIKENMDKIEKVVKF
ncbi:MAG: NAD-dependent epimerase/dehydratase family protein [archaeon YNP-LCB-003-016]|uniref:NAD-dependent epimerase/dehydratase family protein n=1 Tax=Candidatus Culexarchaeum yellowstonense TaxID=2928963 RepID=UPI0026EFF172|nr:NAD-dependent epimerase/dehydratase family protein [Candidatus Culexarchaeum yellowstonense]MCR6692196.1 NAD-dependent epimerase/dehydratase family protein [Candidatus Culexarchaeum yellowstonense]